MKICILSSFEDSLSRHTGYSTRIYNLAKGLAKLGNKVYVIIPGYKQFRREIDGLDVRSIKGVMPKRFLKLLSRIIGVAKPASLYFYDPMFVLKVCRIIRQVDAVQIEQQAAGVLFAPIITRFCKKPLIADCHDVFQALRVKNTGKIRRILETFFETITYRFADLIVTASEEEKRLLISYGIGKGKIEIVPNGVDTEYFNVGVDASHIKRQYSLEDSRIVVFVGNIEYAPNKEAVQLIVSQIAPLVQKKVNNVKFLIVGRTRTKFNSSHIIFTGTVDNVAEVLNASKVAIAPLMHGSGTRLKILEYFSCGLPVVSTTIGVEGLRVKNRVHALIEDDLLLFASKIVDLLNNKELSAKLGAQARELVVNEYDWIKITKRLCFLHQKLLAKR